MTMMMMMQSKLISTIEEDSLDKAALFFSFDSSPLRNRTESRSLVYNPVKVI
jgi:hypothetical protein